MRKIASASRQKALEFARAHARIHAVSEQMMLGAIVAAVKPSAARSVRRWLFHLGGVGLIPLGLLDNSLIPLTGSMDVVTILLASRQGDWWPYYALMATAGSVLGGFVTYRLARRGGKATLERRFSRGQVDKVYKIFGRWGFSAIAIAALLPPPAPIVPFLLTAGVMQYPVKKFLAALALGRAARYAILAYLAARYGPGVIAFVARHARTAIWIGAGLLVVVAIAISLFAFLRKRRAKM
jgi:membrane protein YqaA with SNARE-associated domain